MDCGMLCESPVSGVCAARAELGARAFGEEDGERAGDGLAMARQGEARRPACDSYVYHTLRTVSQDELKKHL